MRMTVLILGLALSMVVFVHTYYVLGLSGIFNGDPSQPLGRSGLLMAMLLLAATAFVFSFPRVSIASFLLATLAGVGRSTNPAEAPDLKFWSVISLGLAALSYYSYLQNRYEEEREVMRRAEEAERHAELIAAVRGEE